MKRFIQFILITVMVAGAGWVFWQDYRTGPIIDSRLDKYVNEWKHDMDSAGIRYKIIFMIRYKKRYNERYKQRYEIRYKARY